MRSIRRGLYAGRAALVIATASLASACARGSAAGGAAPRGGLEARIDSIIHASPVDQVQWGVFAVELESGQIVYEHQAGTKFIPASNQKLLTAAAALHWLGPDFRYPTALARTGSMTTIAARPDSVPARPNALAGDLVLIPSGDPMIASPRVIDATNALSPDGYVGMLRAAGIDRVLGTLVVDASLWDSATAVPSWMVEDLAAAATGGVFVLAEGQTTVFIRAADAPGGAARVTWQPYGEDGFIQSRIETVAAGSDTRPVNQRITASYLPESRRIVLQGRISAGTTDSLRVGTRDPVRQAAAAFARAIQSQGVQLTGGWRVAWNPGEPLFGDLGCATGGTLLYCAQPIDMGSQPLEPLMSPRLLDVLRFMLKTSDNWTAEQIVRSLGGVPMPSAPVAAQPGIQGPPRQRIGWATGFAAVRRYLIDVAGVDSLDFQLRDGSGLSAQNVVTPRAIVQVLDQAVSSPYGRDFRNSLPEPMEASSTLSTRLQGLTGRVYAKTGSLTNVATLSGYLIKPNGRTIMFSIMTNGSGLPGATVRAAIDQVVRELAR